jgi:hypothetical protein
MAERVEDRHCHLLRIHPHSEIHHFVGQIVKQVADTSGLTRLHEKGVGSSLAVESQGTVRLAALGLLRVPMVPQTFGHEGLERGEEGLERRPVEHLPAVLAAAEGLTPPSEGVGELSGSDSGSGGGGG